MNVCRTNAAMKRALAAAEARDWPSAASAAVEARATSADPQEQANIDGFIARCQQAAVPPRSAAPSTTLVLAWLLGLALVLFANSAIFPNVSDFRVDGTTVRIRGVRGQTVSGDIPTGMTLSGWMAYPLGLQFQVQNGAGGSEQQTVVAPVQPGWPQTNYSRGSGGVGLKMQRVSLRIPNAPGSMGLTMQGQIIGPTRFPRVSGANQYEERNDNVALRVDVEVLSGIRSAIAPIESAFAGVLKLVKSWSGLIGIILFFSFWSLIPPWIGSRFGHSQAASR